jgi:hypothetical protein
MRVMGNPRDALGKSMLTSLAKLFKRKIVRIESVPMSTCSRICLGRSRSTALSFRPRAIGEWCLVDYNRNWVVQQNVDVEKLGES